MLQILGSNELLREDQKVTFSGLGSTIGNTTLIVTDAVSCDANTSYKLTMVQSKHKQGTNMRHKITLILSLVIIIGASVFAVHQYDRQHHINLVSEAKAKITAFEVSQAKQAKALQSTKQLNSLKAQCASDHAKYLVETPAERALKTSVTDCNPALVVAQ
jgi:uncharacterized protein HemX